MTILRTLGTAGAIFAAAGSVSAQPPESRLHYDGSMAIDTVSGHVELDWIVTVAEPDVDSLTFLLSSAFEDVEIGGDVIDFERGSLSTFDGEVPAYTIRLQPSSQGEPRRIDFAYDGVLLPQPMETRINTVDPEKVELTVDSFWLPFDLRFSQVTAELDIAIAGEWSGVGIETLVPTSTGFRLEQSRPALDVAFTLMSRFERVEADGYVIYDTRADPGNGMEPLIGALEFCTGYLNAMAGPAGPLPPAAVTVNDREEAGYSRGTLIALTDIGDEDPVALLQFICHELAHYWSRGNPMTVENWLNESFADAMANMGVREAFGEAALEARLQRYREQAGEAGEPLPAVWVPGAAERPSYLVAYRKGPLALARLESLIGRDRFMELMQAYVREGIATTPDLLDALEEIAGAGHREAFEAILAE